MFEEIKLFIQEGIKALKKMIGRECEVIEQEPESSKYWKKGNTQKQYALSMIKYIFPKDK